MAWTSLHTHSQYSILDATPSVLSLAQTAASLSMESLALTDFCNLFGAVDFFKACKSVGIKSIIGCEIMVAPFSRHDKKKLGHYQVGYPLILLAKNQVGYKNLCKISSIGYLEGFYYTPRVDKEVLTVYREGLICLSGPAHSRLSQLILQEKKEELQEELDWCQKTYGEDFYFELQRHRMRDAAIAADGIDGESWLYQSYLDRVQSQEKLVTELLALSREKGIPTVATNDIHYLKAQDWKVHEILINIQSGQPCEVIEFDSYGNSKGRSLNPKRRVLPSHEHYFKSSEEMAVIFADVPEALANTSSIAAACNVTLDFDSKFYPVFVPPHLEGKKIDEKERVKEGEDYLQKLCEENIEARYTPDHLAKIKEKHPDREPMEMVKKRLFEELTIINTKGLCDYLLIVYDLISWAKKQGIPVGPGRGSGAGSIILYLIGITDIDPLCFHLFFERFINPERMSYPDIDVDICVERRSEVIDYTVKKYGKEKVAQIITFGTMKAKMAIKDVGRVLSVPLPKVNQIAKLVPEDPTITLEEALKIDQELRRFAQEDEDGRRILEYALKLEGSIRSTGVHAAGIIICGEPLTDHIPLTVAKDSEMAVTQYSMRPVADVGMLKIDVLGLKTLTSIQKAIDFIENITGQKIDWVHLPLDDKKTLMLLSQGKTIGIFQLESSGMQALAKQLHIDKFEEIIAVGALYRPGPMAMIPSFINRKHGREKIEVDHPLIEEITKETYGIVVYQEQVMQIASRLAGYTLGEGDVLRRAMGKKDKKEMAKQREKFRRGALDRGIDEAKAMEIFDKIEKFASYGFNKSHAVAYGYLSYVTAYLKANYPKEWLCALMTCDKNDLTKVAKHIREAETMNLPILSPDVNEAGVEFVPVATGIRFAMSGIKGVGSGVVEEVIKERKRGGAFKSLYDFFKRVDTSKVGKKVAQNLISAGSFDFTGWRREALLLSVTPFFTRAVREQKEKAKGILDFFSLMEEEDAPLQIAPEVKVPLQKKQLLAKERELLGFYLTGHPMDEYRTLIEQLQCRSLDEVANLPHEAVCQVAFVIESVKVKIASKTQQKFAILTISDGIDHFELPIWSNLYEEKTHLFVDNQLAYAILQIDKEGETLRLRCQVIEGLTELDENKIATLKVTYQQIQDRAKMGARRKKKMPEQESKKQGKQLNMTLDANQVRLSQIVELKNLFHKFPGNGPIFIDFCDGEHPIATLEVESKWGIGWNRALEEELKRLVFIQSFSFAP